MLSGRQFFPRINGNNIIMRVRAFFQFMSINIGIPKKEHIKITHRLVYNPAAQGT